MLSMMLLITSTTFISLTTSLRSERYTTIDGNNVENADTISDEDANMI